ncbi:fungal-specific transcription factor domain-containing protein [Biscogniauxia marginata]|nr:fungal-specific transcription factor domain-containing protein [Biscogniauxia marginata]
MDPYQQQGGVYDPADPAETADRLDGLAPGAPSPHPFHVPATQTASSYAEQLQPAFVGSTDSTAGGAGGASSQASQQREQTKAKRRVPNSQRKRTQMSCDACKTKRCKCIRLWPAPSHGDEMVAAGDELPPCKLCTAAGIPCVTSMPRKQRVYGSVEDLDKRYRALESLVSGVFPGLNAKATADELVAFGQGIGLAMPDFSEASDAAAYPTPSSTQGIPTNTPGIPTSPTDRRQSSSLLQASGAYEEKMIPRAYTTKSDSTQGVQALPELTTEKSLGPEDGRTGLIVDASGRPHYVGPCGALTFFANIRELAAQRSAATEAGRSAVDHQTIPISQGGANQLTDQTLAGSLAGVGHDKPDPGPSMQAQSSIPPQNHLEGDSPPLLFEDNSVWSLGYPDDPDYWRYRKLVSAIELPPRSQADTCIEAYFRHVHPNFILFHRGTFQRAYEKLWRSWEAGRKATLSRDAGEVSVSVGWLCCLYMMFVFGSRSLRQNRNSLEFQRKWFAEVDRLPPLLSTSSLPNVCAYMLLSLHYHNTNDRTSAWTFHGSACRLAIALGMHREKVSSSFDPLHEHLRKRVWWTMYQYEQFLCCSLGRPSAIDDREMDVGVPNDDFLEGNLLPADHLRYAVKLDMLHAAIRREIYDPATIPSTMCSRALEFLLPLAAWEENLPKRLRPVPSEQGLNGNEKQWRSIHLLYIRQQDTLNFLTRPFLLRAIQSINGGKQLGPDAMIITGLSKVCVAAAMRCGESIMELFRAGFLNGISWLDIFFSYVSSIIISLALLSPKSLGEGESILSPTQPLIPWPRLLQEYSRDEMTATVRQLCKIMTTVDMCGTSARFAKMAVEFAKAVGVIDKENSDPERSSISDPRDLVMDLGQNAEKQPGGGSAGYQFRADTSQGDQSMAGTNIFPIIEPEPNFERLFDSNLNLGISSDAQWDMVLPPPQWNVGGLNMDMDFIWQRPNENPWLNPGQYPVPPKK